MASTDATSEIAELIERLPHSADALAFRAESMSAEGRAADAERILRAALARHSVSVLRVTLARVLLAQERPKEAMAEMVGVLRREPENSSALLVLAACLLECGELERGIKMLEKARAAGANASAIADIEDRYARLLSRATSPNFADRTREEPLGGAGITRPGGEPLVDSRKRHQTLMGRPNPEADRAGLRQAAASGKQTGAVPPSSPPGKRVPPPPLQSGTFSGLTTYDLEGESEGLDDTGVGERVRFGADPLPAAQGQSRSRSGEFASAEEHTFAGRLATASPDEATSHIRIDELELADRSAASSSWDQLPSVEYDASFAEEARHARRPHNPPADLDRLPSWSSQEEHVEQDPTRPEDPRKMNQLFAAHNVMRADLNAAGVLPALDASVLFDDESINEVQEPEPLDIPIKQEYRSEPQQRDFTSQVQPSQTRPPRSGQQPQQQLPQPPAAPRQPQPPRPASSPNFLLEGNSVPVDQRWTGGQGPPPRREETAVAADPRRSSASDSGRLLERRWPIVVVLLLAVVLAGFLGLCIASGTTLNSDLEAAIISANEARAPDTYEGHLQAERKLLEAANATSFMGGGFDSFVEQRVPIPGLGATRLRRNVVADLAAVSAILEYRFESEGTHKGASRVEAAKARAGSNPLTAVGAAYLEMSALRPHVALQILDEARQNAPNETRLDETRAWALLALDRPSEAAQTIQPLRGDAGLSVHQMYLIAAVDAARGDETASKSFADVFTESPDHIDSRIGRSYTLRKDAADIAKAQQVLDTVLGPLSRKASIFQKARATSAYGSALAAAGEKEKAEEHFRDSIRTMPGRSELYPPLLRFYVAQGRIDETEKYLAKAREEGAYSPTLALFEARLRLINSQPEKASKILGEIEFDDARKAFLKGLALIDAYQYEAAVAALEKAQQAPGETLDVQALFHLARAHARHEALEDAIYQLSRLKSKNADNAIVHWALGAAELLSADVTTSKTKRAERLKAARLDLQRAIELNRGFAPAHFHLCEVLIRELETDKAEAACEAGRTVAPNYAPGMVSTARLRIAQGRFADAETLSRAATAARPDDGMVGLLAARIAIEQRRVADARKELNRWIADPADPFEMNLLEGRLEFTQNQYTKAAGFLKKAYEMRPVDGEAAMFYAHTLTRLGEDKAAAEILLDNLSHPTWSGYAWAVLGEARRRQNKLDDAFENFAKARKIYEGQDIAPRYWSHLYSQWALAAQKRYRKWRHSRVLDKLKAGRTKGDADDPEINLMWSRYHLEKRKPDTNSAMRSLERVVEAAPYHCEAVDALRSLYINEDRKDDLKKLEETRDPQCALTESSEKKSKKK